MRGSIALVVASLVVAGACSDGDGEGVIAGGAATEATATTASALALPRCDEVAELTTAPDQPELADDPEVAAWQRSRAEMGLPADETTTRAIAADPNHVVPFDFPTTPEEQTALFAAEATSSGTAGEVSERFAADPAYGGHWVDSVNRSVVVLATVDDPEAWQTRADAEIGPGKVRVIDVANSVAQLDEARDAAMARLEELGLVGGGSGDLLMQNVTSIFLEVLDPELVAAIAEGVPAGTVCVEGAEPSDVVPDGPQPQSGDGWRLLADEPGKGLPYATGFADDPAELANLWATVGLEGPIPEIDFAKEAVAWFGPAVSGSCSNIRLDDVVFDAGTAVLSPVIVQPGGARVCTSDANPHAYIVALDRSRLPNRFTVSLGAPNAECCPEGTTQVDLDAK